MKTAIELATEAGFDTDLPEFKDGTALALKLIKVTMLACANECDRTKMFRGGKQESSAHHGVEEAATALRLIASNIK